MGGFRQGYNQFCKFFTFPPKHVNRQVKDNLILRSVILQGNTVQLGNIDSRIIGNNMLQLVQKLCTRPQRAMPVHIDTTCGDQQSQLCELDLTISIIKSDE